MIKNIWIVNCGDSNRIERMIPFGCMDLAYVENSSVSYQKEKIIRFAKNDIFITGQVTKPYDFEYEANSKIIGFGFFPHTAHLFAKEDSSLFTDQVYHLDDLYNSKPLLEKLAQENKIEDKINLLQLFILEKIKSNKNDFKKHDYLRFLLKKIFTNKGKFDISSVQKELKISKRYIQRLFKEYVGIQPMLYAKVVRFLNALESYPKDSMSLTGLAYDLNYFDQSHFIRDFKRFTGSSPRKYFLESSKLVEQFTSNEHSSLLYNSIPE